MQILEVHPDLGRLMVPLIHDSSIRVEDVVATFSFNKKAAQQEKVMVILPWLYKIGFLENQQLFEHGWFYDIQFDDDQTGSDRILNELLPWPQAVPI
eukprot:UN02862